MRKILDTTCTTRVNAGWCTNDARAEEYRAVRQREVSEDGIQKEEIDNRLQISN